MLKILHVLRSPVGGLFRHVIDLARAQAARGHKVGIVADSSTGGARADAAFAALSGELALGLTRVPMSRHVGASDVSAQRHVAQRARETDADVLHGHGAKGGAYARLCGGRFIRAYTPHGGSLHYSRSSPVGLLYLTVEQVLMARTELFLFESRYGRDVFTAKIGAPRSLVRVVHNGVTVQEFAEVGPQDDATDVVFVGELRLLKGVDVLLEALAVLAREAGATATIVGAGPDAEQFREQAERLGLSSSTHFLAPMPARDAFRLGRLLVVPSRAESLPYIVLEAAAAAVPIITTNVGGIPEVFGPQSSRLIAPGDAPALARAISSALADPAALRDEALTLRARVRAEFSAEGMADAVLAAYGEALNRFRRQTN
ncbi:MAG: glycosyltransferase family 4 protein [Alphaproteobacteria bacterium]|nr:MAG: glycosyltransferase family 4 protein [Alphaproteobacteria bacterium]